MEFIKAHPFALVILMLYVMNAFFHVKKLQYGTACYWLAAAMITISAEFLIPKYS